jgi:outer membrane biogenesis lipoprotein LolB
MLKHIKKTFLPVMLCLVLCTCTACTSRSKEETETSETETDSAVSAYQNVLREIRQNHIFIRFCKGTKDSMCFFSQM